VGLLLSQIGRRAGARVIGTAGGPEKVELAKQGGAGAHEVIDYKISNFVEEVKRLTDGRGVQVVYDSVGKDTFAGSLDCLALRGTLALFGQSSGRVDPVDPQVLNQKGSLFLTRPTLFHYAARREELLERAGDVFRWIERGELTVRIFREVPLKDAAEAHAMLEGRKTSGKLLLIP
jgi:NADPH2:quinone reductase